MVPDPELIASLAAVPNGVAVAARQLLARLDGLPADRVVSELAALGQLRLDDHPDAGAAGAVYTPYEVAAELVGLAGLSAGDTVCDPSVGGGVFLLAAAEHLYAREADAVAVESALAGLDIDPSAVNVSRLVLQIWMWWRYGVVGRFVGLALGDGLLDEVFADRRFDLVIGNPPFLGQLKQHTTRSLARSRALRARYGDVVTAYVDDSALFVLRATELVSQTGAVCLIVPASTLGSASTRPVRQRIQAGHDLVTLWIGGRTVFPTVAVDVVAPVLAPRVDGPPRREVSVIRHGGGPALTGASPGDEWQRLLAGGSGVPTVSAASGPTLGSLATVGADFRDAYYWLSAAVVDGQTEDHRSGGPSLRLATVGLVDPLHFRHGRAEVRFAKRRVRRPVVDPARVDDARFPEWLRRRLVPKILVATQTRVLECVVDAAGDLVPSTPLLVVECLDAQQIWHVAAALTSPFVSAWAATEASGTGLTSGAFRLRASQLREAPLPLDSDAWDQAAAMAQELYVEDPASDGPPAEEIRRLGSVLNEAYGCGGDEVLLDWWFGRLPSRR